MPHLINDCDSPATDPASNEDSITNSAEYYRQVLEAGVHNLFEQRATVCPMCEEGDLVREQTLTDLVQLKPGFFHISRCRSCGHLFQNPRLNAKGLEFYYRDFYTGAGEATVSRHLEFMTSTYRARARMIKGRLQPIHWLDVGAGYGHFARTAREVWPSTKFDVLDQSPCIAQAEQAGWADRAYTGNFLDLAPRLHHSYDVVSMFHYLEHTVDPICEIHAVSGLLEPEGLLMIEVPDPDSIGRRWMGRYWPSWLAPQHLHFFPARNMQKYLREAGFDPILWHRARAHQATDASLAMENYLQHWSAVQNLPWNVYGVSLRRRGLFLMRMMQQPVRISMRALDLVLSPFRFLPRWPNTYRVLARKRHS
jgi:2-polyprenyl-3-methyl-5-hydroxy-6-metoxy-1,4-benzoquinol methylase